MDDFLNQLSKRRKVWKDDLLEKLWGPEPDLPKKKRKMKKTPRNMLEAVVQYECIEWLMAHKDVVYVERRNTGALTTMDGSFIKFGKVGAADIWCLVRPPSIINERLQQHVHYWKSVPMPWHVEIECKRRDGKGRLTGSQLEFKQLCEVRGIPYFVVTSAVDLDKKFRRQLQIFP